MADDTMNARVEVLRDVIHWAGTKCPAAGDEEVPCSLCGASGPNGMACRAVESIFPPELLQRLRAALTASDAVAQAPQQPVERAAPEPTFNWNNTDGEARKRFTAHHAQWAEDEMRRLKRAASPPREEDVQRLVAAAKEEALKDLEAEKEEAYQDGYEEGKSDWRGVKAQLWNAIQRWLTLRHDLQENEEDGYTVSDLLDGLAEVEAENKRLRERQASIGEAIAAARREALEEAAALIEATQIYDSSKGHGVEPRLDGNRAGLAYADAIRSLIQSRPSQEGK